MRSSAGRGVSVQTAAELQQLFRLLGAYGCSDWLLFDASIMRGLAYYTGRCHLLLPPALCAWSHSLSFRFFITILVAAFDVQGCLL